MASFDFKVGEVDFFPAGGVIVVEEILAFTGGDFSAPSAPEIARFRTGVARMGDGVDFAGTGAFVIFSVEEAFRTGTGF